MGGYVLRRVLFTIPTLIGISFIIFFMVRLLPGDYIDILGGDTSITDEQKAASRAQLGLDGSYAEQYWRWVSGIFHGDFGFSFRNTEPVSDVLIHALPITTAIRRPRKTSSAVIGSAWISTSETGSVFRNENPKSPWKMPLTQRQYCSAYDPSRPSCAREAAFCSSVIDVSPPRMSM